MLELFLFFVVISTMTAFINYKIGLWLVLVVGLLSDPVRKLTEGNPLYLTLCVGPVFFASYLSMFARKKKTINLLRMYPNLTLPFYLFIACLIYASLLSLIQIGSIPLLSVSLAQYLGIVLTIYMGFHFVDREKTVINTTRLFVITVTPFLFTVLLHYLGYAETWAVLNTMAFGAKDYVGYHGGISVKMLNGVFRNPEGMGWFAMTAVIGSIYLLIRYRSSLFWRIYFATFSLFGIFCILVSGRRKMFYGIILFLFIFIIQMLKKTPGKMIGTLIILVILSSLGYFYISSQKGLAPYITTAETGIESVEKRTKYGIVGSTQLAVKKYGFFGAGLGAASQGGRRFSKDLNMRVGGTETGGGKIAAELGIQGMIIMTLLLIAFITSCLKVIKLQIKEKDLFVTHSFLFALTCTHLVSFVVSYQIYSDPLVGIMTGFMMGMLLAFPKAITNHHVKT